MGELSKLPNIGPVVEGQLEAVGIETLEQLQEIGSREAWLRIQQMDPSACIHRLMGLEGALLGVKKSLLPPDTKAQLRAFYQTHKL
ncbi:hypothetical protein SDC9_139816 [bioreactor metagenome]|uniref:TfoX C-terminal domain-containing protein n=1 Tax=bioreactor metagenome TaxID=1076179 RepID=A0A645DTN0_9ZZZZ